MSIHTLGFLKPVSAPLLSIVLISFRALAKLAIMPKALILVADGSEEIEFVTPYDGMQPNSETN